MLSRLRSSWLMLLLGAVIAASAAQAVWWVFLVPIYESPDEPAHLDYALGIHANKGLLIARHTTFKDLPVDAHPYTPYLRKRSGVDQIAFNSHAKVPLDYGKPGYFAALDRDAPPRSSIVIDHPCQLAALYPFGYYALVALWIEGVAYFKEGIVATFFGARLLSVVLLVITLSLIYATTRLLHYRPAFGVLITACIGLFPLTSFISSYVQPDNLSFTLVTLSYYLALRARNKRLSAASVFYLGTALGALLVTKIHFWLAVTPAVVGMIAAEMFALSAPRRRWLSRGVCLLTPSLLLGSVWLWTVWGTENYFAPPDRSLDRMTSVLRLTRTAIEDYFGGPSHISFWGVYGWLDTPLKFRNTRATEAIGFLVQATTWILFGLTLLRIERIASRLYTVTQAGRGKAALRMALSNPVINSYFLFTALMIFLFVWTSNRFGAQGRNWFPLMLPIFLVSLDYAPRALTLAGSRRALATFVALGFLFFGIVGNHYARESVRARYYYPPNDQPLLTTPDLSEPLETHEMTWASNAGTATGNDPYVIFALDRPTFVYAVRIRFTSTNRKNDPATFHAFWKNGEQNFVEHERSLRHIVPSGREWSATIWINSEISHLRLDPDARPCDFEIHELTMLRESEATRDERDARDSARRRPRKPN